MQKVGNGHPGTAMSLAPLAYLLYQRVMRHDPTDPDWVGRDRFILSNGHSSLTQYCQLFLSGYGLELADLEALRTWGSLTPGHPEYGHTARRRDHHRPARPGRRQRASAWPWPPAASAACSIPDAAPGESPFDHHIYVIAGDGCLEEGVSSEASSLGRAPAARQPDPVLRRQPHLDRGRHRVAFSEDVLERYEAYGWHTQRVDSGEDVVALEQAIARGASAVTDGRRSSRCARSSAGRRRPSRTPARRTAPRSARTRSARPRRSWASTRTSTSRVDADVLAHARQVIERGRDAHAQWQAGSTRGPPATRTARRCSTGCRPAPCPTAGPTRCRRFPTEKDGKANSVSTRAASGKVLTALADVLPELWGGSADLAESNNTTMEGEPSFIPAEHQTKMWTGGPYGRTLHFGIREHAMGSIMNGITLHGGTRVYGGTFLVFSDYMRPPVRLAALMQLPTIYVWTHDSIGLGGDGPTHQPIEHLAALRAIPGPGRRPPRRRERDRGVLAGRRWSTPTARPALALSRQNLPVLDAGQGRRRGEGRLRPRGGLGRPARR